MTEEAKTAGEVNPIGEIRIQMNDQAIVFKPTDDITGNEVARLMVMFMNGLLAKSPVDFGAYINQHNLGKHFALLNPPEKEE
jgi:hypothetical protein